MLALYVLIPSLLLVNALTVAPPGAHVGRPLPPAADHVVSGVATPIPGQTPASGGRVRPESCNMKMALLTPQILVAAGKPPSDVAVCVTRVKT